MTAQPKTEMMQTELSRAAELILAGELVALPTETVYGLGGNAMSDVAVAKIYEAKSRPTFNPLIVHVPDAKSAAQHVKFNSLAERLAEAFWPGALTLVLPRREDSKLSLLVSAGLDSVAIRVPSHLLALELLRKCAVPVAAPSANRSGRISPTLPQHVQEELGNRVAMILDGGACEVGVESTVVDCTGKIPTILRPGGITREQIEAVVGKVALATPDAAIKAPGMLESHYAPSKPMRLNAADVRAGEALLAFGMPVGDAEHVENLSTTGDVREAAANLFRMLRALDDTDAAAIAVMPIPDIALGVAINDWLKRAAAGS